MKEHEVFLAGEIPNRDWWWRERDQVVISLAKLRILAEQTKKREFLPLNGMRRMNRNTRHSCGTVSVF